MIGRVIVLVCEKASPPDTKTVWDGSLLQSLPIRYIGKSTLNAGYGFNGEKLR